MSKKDPAYWLIVIGLAGLLISILGSLLDPEGKTFQRRR